MKGSRIGEFEEVVLLCVRRLGDGATVVAIRELLAHAAGRRASLGAIYSALDRAERKGLALSRISDPLPTVGGRARRSYRLSKDGEVAVRESRRVRESLWSETGQVTS